MLALSTRVSLAQETPPAAAQQQVQALKRMGATQEQILARLKTSGLTREQVRDRLRLAGYDPNLADQYFDELARTDSVKAGTATESRYTRPLTPPSGSLVAALKRIGVLMPDDSLDVAMPRPDTVRTDLTRRREIEKEPQVFGRELFSASTQFDPVMIGPIDPGYRLGPGDELTLLVTGDVEVAYELQVTREGYIVIPDVGQVIVNGLTLAEAKNRLNERLARVYSGINAGSAQADVTVGRLRSKLVYVVGEAEVPGAHTLSGSATVFSALYKAGGPALNGSFRRIEVRRNNRVIRQVDVYAYLLHGDKSGDVTLEQGDVVFIPLVGPQVTVEGEVRRPAIFELKEGERLEDVLRFAGGAAADAAIERIQIDRILPVTERRPGRERVLVDVELTSLARGEVVPMQDGDRIKVLKISETRRNRVEVSGDVQRPGEYEYRAGMTAWQLIENAGGLLPSAFTPTAHVVRIDPSDSTTSIVRVVLDDPASPDHASRVALGDLDELVIFGRSKLANPRKIEIYGYVKNEGVYTYADGMTIQDLVLIAGGFTEGAAESTAEVARRVPAGAGRDTLATVHRVPLDLNGSAKGSGLTSFPLREGDQVFIRRLPNFQVLATVDVTGEVMYPGPYTVSGRQERVSDLVARAGGLTAEAYAPGLRLFRDGKPIGVNFQKALKNPGGVDDIAIEAGDRLEVPRYDPTVLVTGAVTFESRIPYEKGLSLDDYLARAGGVTDDGNASKASVRYPNGAVRTKTQIMGIRRVPDVQPGSTITVPVKAPNSGFNWDSFLSKTLAVMSTVATLIVAYSAIN